MITQRAKTFVTRFLKERIGHLTQGPARIFITLVQIYNSMTLTAPPGSTICEWSTTIYMT